MDTSFDFARERIISPQPKRSKRGWFISVALLFALTCGGVGYLWKSGYDFHALLVDKSTAPHDFLAFYKSHEIDPIPQAVMTRGIYNDLLVLEKSPCDWQAANALGSALSKTAEKRIAAQVYLNYSQSCASDGTAERMAADLFLSIKDYEKALALYVGLTDRSPYNELNWYHRGQAEHGLGLTDKAVHSFTNLIALTKDQAEIGDWVFNEFSSIYADVGRFCEAMMPLSTYVSLDPASRDTARSHAILASLAQKGKCDSYATGVDSFPVSSPGVVSVKASINGVEGTFAVDTGATFVAISQEFAERAKIIGGREENFVTANGITTGKTANATTIKLGKIQAKNVSLVILSKLGKSIDGLLGRSFLTRFEMKWTDARLTLKANASDLAHP